jgi:hypothetical protein
MVEMLAASKVEKSVDQWVVKTDALMASRWDCRKVGLKASRLVALLEYK